MPNRIALQTRAVAAVLICLLIGGCTTVVNGTGVRAPGGPPPGEVDTSLLDPGNYATTARSPLGVAGNAKAGAILEAQRMADFVVDPSSVSPAISAGHTFGFTPGATVLTQNPDALGQIMRREIAEACARHDYVNGFVVAREDTGKTVLYNAVIRMAHPESASAAARDMGETALGLSSPVKPVALPIAGHTDTTAATHSGRRQDGQEWTTVESFTAHGPYVLYQRVESTGTAQAAAALVSTAIDIQAPLIDKFQPTDPAQFAELPKDPSGLLARALPIADKDATVMSNGTWGPTGAAHIAYDPLGSLKAFTDAGMDTAVNALDWVFQARDPSAAAVLADVLYAEAQSMGRPADPVPNLKPSRCLQFTANQDYYCVVSVGRYAVEVTASQLRDAHQQMAAQYILLAGK